jgi:hypothetical protein
MFPSVSFGLQGEFTRQYLKIGHDAFLPNSSNNFFSTLYNLYHLGEAKNGLSMKLQGRDGTHLA